LPWHNGSGAMATLVGVAVGIFINAKTEKYHNNLYLFGIVKYIECSE